MKKFLSFIISLILFIPALILTHIFVAVLALVGGSFLVCGIIVCLLFGAIVAIPLLFKICKFSISVALKIILSLAIVSLIAILLFFLTLVAF